jgi:aminoglycoside phosphotransferase (APT) family kinase protein
VDEILPGGVANAGSVVRKGDFVLRPSNHNSDAVHAFLRGLRSVGFEGASLPVEIQADGRERLHFIEGEVAVPPIPVWAQTDRALSSIVVLMRAFHQASSRLPVIPAKWSDELADPCGGTMICHNDVCFENVVFKDGEAVALLDFDFAAPGRPLFDLAACARMCVPVDDDLNASRLGFKDLDRPARLRLVADTYGLDAESRHALVELLDQPMESGGSFVQRRVEAGDPNFIRMLDEMGGMERYERRLRWWQASRETFVQALR